MLSQDQSSLIKATQVKNLSDQSSSSSSGAKATTDAGEDLEADVDELIERTWHYECVVSPIHPSSTPSQLSLNPSPLVLNGPSSRVPPSRTKPPLRGNGSIAIPGHPPIQVSKPNNTTINGASLPESSEILHGSNDFAVRRALKLPRGNPEAISEESEEKDEIQPLRQVRVMMPKNWSELRGYVSLSSFIDDQSSSHGGGYSIPGEPTTQVSPHQGAMGMLSGLLRLPLISSSKAKRHSSSN